MKDILDQSFVNLILIYSVLIFIISFGFLSKYTLHFEIFALIIAIFGFFSLKNKNFSFKNKNLSKIFLIVSLVLILITRVYPYLHSSVPLGYDPGMYKYAIETPLSSADNWLYEVHEPLFVYSVQFLNLFLPINATLIWLFIVSSMFLGFIIYICSKEYFGEEAAAFSVLIYALSVIQFKAYWYMYYRNILGMALLLLAFYYLKRNKQIPFIITAGVLGGIHRPTFYLFGLSYLIYAFTSPYNKKYALKKLKTNILSGITILILFFIVHIGKFSQGILSIINPVVESFAEPGQSSGTFINFFTYQYSILPYLVLGLFGFFYLLRKKDFNILTIWFIINAVIVVFKLFFFNRFIIQLDLALIILSGLGAVLIISERKILGLIIVAILLISASIFAFNQVTTSRPLITQTELNSIKQLSTTPVGSYVMNTNSVYSPWVVGYSDRKTISPGLFDYDVHSKTEWNVFWSTNNITEIKKFMDAYQKPLYIYIGPQQANNLAKFQECFEVFYNKERNYIYKYIC